LGGRADKEKARDLGQEEVARRTREDFSFREQSRPAAAAAGEISEKFAAGAQPNSGHL